MSKNFSIDLVEFPASSPEELKKTTTFYSDVFGWQFKEYGPTYSDTQSSGLTAGVNASDEAERQKMPLAVIYADDVDAALQKVQQAGGKVVQQMSDFPGGRRFHFADPAGNEVAVWGK